jgi:peptidoglycan hydrolase-like protein with peptidoglycan-binding domain
MNDLVAFFDVLTNNRADIEDVVAKLGGLGGALKFAAGAGPDLVRIMGTIASHQDPMAAAAQARVVLAYTTATEERVKAFQAAHGLTVDGVVGDQTWSKVEQLLNPHIM